jgi:hypothetical protein
MNSEENKNENPVEPIELSIFKEHIKNNFLSIIDSLPKLEKFLILDKSCEKKLNFIISFKELIAKKYIKNTTILTDGTLSVDSPIIIYVIPPKKECVQIINKHIERNHQNQTSGNENIIDTEENKDIKGSQNKEYHIIFFPRIINECQTYINESIYRALFNIHNLNMDIYPLDYELMSLEDENSFHQLYVTNNYNSLFLLNRAIIKYETVFGKIKYKYYKGNLSKQLKEMLDEEEKNINLEEEPKTLACIMFDRTVDMITPLITNYVYEALLDDNFGINYNKIIVSPSIFEKETKNKLIELDLSTNDKFYTKIKDYNFSQIRSYLPARLQEQNKIIENSTKRTRDLNKIQEDLENVSKIKDERLSLTNHINLADFIAKKDRLPLTRFYYMYEQGLLLGDNPDRIQEFIFDEIRKKSDEYEILKIICLYSIVHSGFKNKIYDQLRKEFFIVYGFQELFMWRNFEKLGVLKISDNQNFYSSVKKKLNLMTEEETDTKEQKDASYAYNGFCPIIIRLLEKLDEKGWGNIKDILKELPGGDYYIPPEEAEVISPKTDNQFILLVFIGGITYGELAGIRFLNKKMRNKKFIILTTNMINRKKMINSLKQGKYTYAPVDPTDQSNIVLTFKEAFNQSK